MKTFDLEKATKLFTDAKNLEVLSLRFALIDPEWLSLRRI